jgi:hypothetical protein
MSSTPVRCCGFPAAAALLLLVSIASPAAAQPVDPNRGRITFIGGLDVANAYLFRGLLREDARLIMWPYAEAAADLYSGTGAVKRVLFQVGTWNSLHTGDTGSNGPSRKMWYESDIYGTLGVGLGGGVNVGATYTAYTSPNGSFSTVKELAVKVAIDDASVPAELKPYALVAFELDTLPGFGQADRGTRAGTYLELGVAPGYTDPAFRIEVPIKVGLSLRDYYELVGVDQKFGYLSLAAVATVPLSGSTDYGTWNLHGGFEFLSLGNTPEAFNGGDQSHIVLSVGLGFVY